MLLYPCFRIISSSAQVLNKSRHISCSPIPLPAAHLDTSQVDGHSLVPVPRSTNSTSSPDATARSPIKGTSLPASVSTSTQPTSTLALRQPGVTVSLRTIRKNAPDIVETVRISHAATPSKLGQGSQPHLTTSTPTRETQSATTEITSPTVKRKRASTASSAFPADFSWWSVPRKKRRYIRKRKVDVAPTVPEPLFFHSSPAERIEGDMAWNWNCAVGQDTEEDRAREKTAVRVGARTNVRMTPRVLQA